MQLGFYASTPAYAPVLNLHGWQDIHTQAHRMPREGQWNEMAALITDEMLNAFAVVCENEAIFRSVCTTNTAA